MAAGFGELSFVLNGREVCASGLAPQTTLLDFLRSEGLTGAKEGCAEGECGACTVLLVAEQDSGSAFHPINSCLMFLPMAAGQEIYTVESLARNGELSGAQRALVEMGGSQCGYCTPGFAISLFAEHHRPGRVGPCDPEAMSGNLCRCTGYRPIRDAALSLSPSSSDTFFTARTAQPAPRLSAIRYETAEAGFLRPTTVDECLDETRLNPEARWLAGATDLAVESNLRFRRWRQLISLDAVAELHEFSQAAGLIRIGAALPLNAIAARWTNPPEAFRQWLPLFASPPVRNRATLGGNLATASPVGDAAPLLIALEATLHLVGPNGRRQVPVDTFFAGYRSTVLDPGELVTAIELPDRTATLTRFYKVAKRRVDDISTVAAGLSLDLDAAGRIRRARFGFGGIAATPLRATGAEEAVIGLPWNLSTVARAQAALARSLHPIGDHRGSAEYRLGVSKALIEKLWWDYEEAAA